MIAQHHASPLNRKEDIDAEHENRHNEHLHSYFLQRLKLKKKHIKD
jgi:hypothetical protein